MREQLAGQLAPVNPSQLNVLKSSQSLCAGAKTLAVLGSHTSHSWDSRFLVRAWFCPDSPLLLQTAGVKGKEKGRTEGDFENLGWKYCFKRHQNLTD